MYHLPTSCLYLFFLFSVSHHLSFAASKKELGWCKALFNCGNITAGFPFSGGIRPEVCGHPSLELHCFKNTTSLIISNHLYDVLDINETSKTLKLSRAELGGSFCNATFSATTLPPDVFELSPTYKSLTVFYLCDRNFPYPSSYNCPGRGPVLVSENLDYQNSCRASFTINVPESFAPEEKELNVTHLESVLSEGFDVKVKIDEKACEDCLSSHGTCGFENTKQICCKDSSSSGCSRLHRPDASELHRRCSQPFSCGNQSGLLYPFWTSDREDCGHPDFKLECSSGSAELSISSVKFRILEANYTSQPRIIRLARSDYIGDLCPTDPSDVPFDESVLPFATNTELLTIYYDCSQDFSQFVTTNVGGELPCGDDDDRGNYYVKRNLTSPLLEGISNALNNLRGSCDRNVSIPASGPALNTLQLASSIYNLKMALEAGFELGLNQDCSTCLDNRGACGYNPSSSAFVCYYIDETNNSPGNKGFSTGVIRVIEYTFGSVATILIAGGLLCLISRRRKTSDVPRQLNLKALIPLKHYSYAQVKIITKSFAEVVGKGGFGTVYRGTLHDGCSVAVKVLKDSKSNGEDFINEVASMSKTSHVNIVTLLGFCAEGSKRAILYEFLENGSLDKFISSKRSSYMDWRELYEIAIGVARGLEYLHHGCRTRIVHFDIKPQNILLDDKLCPKVSDFGLAKLCERKESILSLLDTRGTIGYIAPEVFSRVYGRVSHKSDVYSYGMLVLEMIGARTKTSTEDTTSSANSMYFPEWIYKDLEKEDNGKLTENGINSEDKEIRRKMTLVGLWCIQSWPSNRPPMNKVVEMMEGNLNALELPPKPVLQVPQVPLQESSMISEDASVYGEICSMNVS